MYKRAFQKRVEIAALLAGLTLSGGCGQDSGQSMQPGLSEKETAQALSDTGDWQQCPAGQLTDYLEEEGTGRSYAYARILIAVDGLGQDSIDNAKAVDVREGTAYISWQAFQTAEEFETYYFAQELADSQLPQECVAELAYYQYQLEEDDYAVDIYRYLNARYGSREVPIQASSSDEKSYRLSQLNPTLVTRELAVRDRVLYGLEQRNALECVLQEPVKGLILNFGRQKLQGSGNAGWAQRATPLSEEELYWIDHEERITTFKDPDRCFTEVGAVEMNLGMRWGRFAMLKEADYHVVLQEGGPALDIHFAFQKEIPEDGFETRLYNRLCMSEPYEMRVTDQDTGELLQEMVVEMSIEVPDMITFADYDGDGYLDMKVDMPTHWNGQRAVVDEFSWMDYYLIWEPDEGVFVHRDKREIQQQGEPVMYDVQPGDTLWEIAERFYGMGARYTKIEAANAELLSENKYLMPGVVLEIPAQ